METECGRQPMHHLLCHMAKFEFFWVSTVTAPKIHFLIEGVGQEIIFSWCECISMTFIN